MLELIVLGQIPGTHIQITIAWFVFGLLGLLLWADMKLHTNMIIKKQAPKKRAKAIRARA